MSCELTDPLDSKGAHKRLLYSTLIRRRSACVPNAALPVEQICYSTCAVPVHRQWAASRTRSQAVALPLGFHKLARLYSILLRDSINEKAFDTQYPGGWQSRPLHRLQRSACTSKASCTDCRG